MSEAWELTAFGIDNLKRTSREDTPLAHNQVRVAFRAASLNFRDWLMVQGLYNPKQPLPLVPVSDGAGVITEVGSAVSQWQAGDRVCPIFAQTWLEGPPIRATLKSSMGGPLDGTLRSWGDFDAEGLVRIPDRLDNAQAATLPCAAVTAWSALMRHQPLQAKDHVLVLGTGGVALFALQFASAMGADVTVISKSDEKLERAKTLGASHALNYRDTPQWGEPVREFTDGEGFHRVIEVGGEGTLDQSIRATRVGGHIALIGVLANPPSKPPNLTRMLMKEIRLQGVLVGPKSSFEEMLQFMETHQIVPLVDRVFDFAHAPRAFEYLRKGAHMGKIVVTVE